MKRFGKNIQNVSRLWNSCRSSAKKPEGKLQKSSFHGLIFASFRPIIVKKGYGGQNGAFYGTFCQNFTRYFRVRYSCLSPTLPTIYLCQK